MTGREPRPHTLSIVRLIRTTAGSHTRVPFSKRHLILADCKRNQRSSPHAPAVHRVVQIAHLEPACRHYDHLRALVAIT